MTTQTAFQPNAFQNNAFQLAPPRQTIANIFPTQLYYTVTTTFGFPIPTAFVIPRNTASSIFLPFDTDTELVGIPTLSFTRPDGTTYNVANSPYVYQAALQGRQFIVYNTAPNELNQRGWWLVVYQYNDQYVSPQFAFYLG